MAKFIILGSFTDQGIKNVKGTTQRAKAFADAAAQMGGRLDVWWTLGVYDWVAMAEAPDAATVTSFLLQLGMQGNSRTSTLEAFDAAEFEKILATLP
ncbi:MAG: hypothetical protein A2X23_11335 [Chloroflexi bacterium GWC2_73_18]|nr:MAG: hypothetical protein A2X23_11335 [Chloroflexi bacterium GWC2_73_18]